MPHRGAALYCKHGTQSLSAKAGHWRKLGRQRLGVDGDPSEHVSQETYKGGTALRNPQGFALMPEKTRQRYLPRFILYDEKENAIMKNKKRLISLLALVAAAAVLLGVWYASHPETSAGDKALTIEVIHGDGSTNIFDVKTTAEYLAEVLVENEIVVDNQSTYGLYILTADGETADESKQEWWCITRGGESMMTGASETPIADGETYELTFMVGYDF